MNYCVDFCLNLHLDYEHLPQFVYLQIFSLHCGPLGASFGEYRDREFMIIDGSTGKFLTARQLPKMILLEVGQGV